MDQPVDHFSELVAQMGLASDGKTIAQLFAAHRPLADATFGLRPKLLARTKNFLKMPTVPKWLAI